MHKNWPELIKQVRAKYNLSQMALSELTAVSQKTISRWERGEVAPGDTVQLQLIDLMRRPTGDLITSILLGVRHCPAPRALSRMPDLNLIAVSPPALEKRPSIADWVGHDLAPIATGVLQDMLDDRALQKAIALQEVACVVSTTDSVLRTREHKHVGKFQTTVTYFSHEGVIYADAVSVPAPPSAVRGYRAVMIDEVLRS